MKDEFGQKRTPVQARETVIAVLFLTIVGFAVWSVALPALDEHHEHEDSAVDEEQGEQRQEADKDKAGPSPKGSPAP